MVNRLQRGAGPQSVGQLVWPHPQGADPQHNEEWAKNPRQGRKKTEGSTSVSWQLIMLKLCAPSICPSICFLPLSSLSHSFTPLVSVSFSPTALVFFLCVGGVFPYLTYHLLWRGVSFVCRASTSPVFISLCAFSLHWCQTTCTKRSRTGDATYSS